MQRLRFGFIARHGLPHLNGKVHGSKSNATYLLGKEIDGVRVTDGQLSARLGANRVQFDLPANLTSIEQVNKRRCRAPHLWVVVGQGCGITTPPNQPHALSRLIAWRQSTPPKAEEHDCFFLSMSPLISRSPAVQLAAASAMQLKPVEAPRHTPRCLLFDCFVHLRDNTRGQVEPWPYPLSSDG
jgi:hypothetical protein